MIALLERSTLFFPRRFAKADLFWETIADDTVYAVVSFAAMRAALRRSQKAERPVVVVAAHLTRSAARHLKQTLDRWIHYTKMQHFEVHHPSDDRMQSSVDFQFLQWHRFNLKTVVFGVDHPVRMDIFYKIMQSCEGLQKATFMALSSLPEDAPADAWVQSTVASRPNLVSLIMQGPSPTGPSKIPVCPSVSRVLSVITDVRTAHIFRPIF